MGRAEFEDLRGAYAAAWAVRVERGDDSFGVFRDELERRGHGELVTPGTALEEMFAKVWGRGVPPQRLGGVLRIEVWKLGFRTMRVLGSAYGSLAWALLGGSWDRDERGAGHERPEQGARMDDDMTMPGAAPAFSAHFTDPVYEDVGDELAPFGSDEGADLLATWDERRDELGPGSTVADVLGGDPRHYLTNGSLDDAMAVQAAGFALLRLTGHIDEEGRRDTLAALELLLRPDRWGPEPQLLRQRDDLRSWAGERSRSV